MPVLSQRASAEGVTGSTWPNVERMYSSARTQFRPVAERLYNDSIQRHLTSREFHARVAFSELHYAVPLGFTSYLLRLPIRCLGVYTESYRSSSSTESATADPTFPWDPDDQSSSVCPNSYIRGDGSTCRELSAFHGSTCAEGRGGERRKVASPDNRVLWLRLPTAALSSRQVMEATRCRFISQAPTGKNTRVYEQ